jgi:putative phage-type endonuclease
MSNDIVQGTAEWFAARAGKVTASRLADMLARTQKDWGASRRNYAAELVVERLTGIKAGIYVNSDMQWGLDQEPHARNAYAFLQDAEVLEVGFVDHPTISMTGASPDGLVGTDGLLEIKCPNTANHISTLLNGDIREKYILQMQWQIACTERQWCDFVSFDPRMPAHMQFYCKRIERNQQMIDMIGREIAVFLKDVDATIQSLSGKYAKAAA